jgi:hypothetical protein
MSKFETRIRTTSTHPAVDAHLAASARLAREATLRHTATEACRAVVDALSTPALGYEGIALSLDPTTLEAERCVVKEGGRYNVGLEFLDQRLSGGGNAQGWEVDRAARDYIERAGYGRYFLHRLGHSLGRQVHAGGVNLDSLETHDTRTFLPGLGFTIEPGVYLPEFGVRSEIDLHVGESGLEITTPVQRDVVLIG